MSVMQRLHDSEIPGAISWLYDGCWLVTLGSENRAQATVGSLAEAEAWLAETARKLYPDSDFSRDRGA